MIPPTHFFHFFSRKEYAFVLDGSLWTLDYADKGDFLVDIDGMTYSVREGPSLRELEEDYLTDEKACLDGCIERIIQEHERFEMTTLQEMHAAELAQFVTEQIIPSYAPDAIDSQGSTVQTRRTPQMPSPLPHKVVGRRKRSCQGKQESCILSSLLARRYLFADRMFFELRRAASSRQRIFHFRGEDLCLGSSKGSLPELEQSYRTQIKARLTAKALEGDSSVSSRIRQVSRDGRLVECIRSGHFHDAASGVGFILRDDRFYVAQSIPAYTLVSRRSGTTRFYEFPEATIGIGLHKDEEGRIGWSEPVVMNRYKHPCLPSDGEMQKMCFGSFCFRSLQQRGTVKRQVLRLLYESKKMLTSGYFDAGMPFNHLDDRQYLEYWKDKADLRAPITNEVAA